MDKKVVDSNRNIFRNSSLGASCAAGRFKAETGPLATFFRTFVFNLLKIEGIRPKLDSYFRRPFVVPGLAQNLQENFANEEKNQEEFKTI